ncbi:MAG: DUF4214 domain-containing protein [Nitrospirae bacterium]|nr:DUF4214 domain-containing protein [Nitrospirota bacterium]
MRRKIFFILVAALWLCCSAALSFAAPFTNNGNGTVTDNQTGLVWQQSEPGYMTWGPALSYCNGLSLGGRTDWRLPNIKELESLTDDTRYNPAIDINYFPNAHASYYWSSTTYAYYPNLAWDVDFFDGHVDYGSKGDSYYVRCVRGGQSGSFGNLVTYYYNSILNRAPEPGGAEGWTSEIERIDLLGIDIKEGFIALGKLFLNSGEYLNMNTTDDAYVIDLYETFLGRTPSQSEADYWAGELSGGLTRNLLLNYFIFSQEFRQYMTGIFGDTTVRPEHNLVNDLYRGFLSRLPDDAGFNYLLGEMQTAQCSGNAQAIRDLTSQMALNFLNSQEYADRNTSNSEYIEDLYNGILRRGAELASYQAWLGALNGGAYTRAEMLQLFVNSAEFQARVQQVIDAGCSP